MEPFDLPPSQPDRPAAEPQPIPGPETVPCEEGGLSAPPRSPDEDPGAASPDNAPEAPSPKRQRLRALLTDRANPSRLLLVLGPWCAYAMVEVLNNNDPVNSLTATQVCFNLLWYYLIFWAVRLLIGRRNLACAVSSGLCFAFGLANHYVLTFRGRIIFPCDILGLKTAANVARDYDYTPDRAIWQALCLLGLYWLLLLAAHALDHRRGRQRLPRAVGIASWAAIAVYLYAFFFTGLLPAVGIYTQQWKTQANGFLLNFMTALRYSVVSAPEGYSAQAAQQIADELAQTPWEAPQADPPENLIVIMNESLADLTASFPNLELSSDPLAFYHSMKEYTVKGTMISPVTGGGTANVEFEFLTGDSLAFLPSSTVAYQLYCYDGIPSLVAQAAGLGYASAAFHPYLSSGWNRTSVYSWLGFDRQLYQDDVQDPQYIRRYISDASDYDQLYRLSDETPGRCFLFNVTMQNHSGYAQGWNNLERSVEVTNPDIGASSVTSQYFSLVQQSDRALEELITHYSASDKRTMIVFFGDHQPPLGNDFYQKLYGKALDDRSTEEVLQQYGVPFFIWANYDIPEMSDLVISSNFLGTLTAWLAGFPLTDWQKLHLQVMEQLPVATTVGFMTADGTVTDDETALPAQTQALYQRYRLMAYNHLFDQKHHPDGFYG